MNDSARLGQGNVTLKLGDESVILRPTLGAVQSLCQKYESIETVINRVGRMDFNATVDVIISGTGPMYATAGQRAALAEKIFQAGMIDEENPDESVLVKVVEYLNNLIRGGKPKKVADKLAAEGKAPAVGN